MIDTANQHARATATDKTTASNAAPTQMPPINAVVKRIRDVSTLPHIALRVLEIVRDPKASAKDVRTVIEGDPALSARVLRCINSAAYALGTNVTNLQQAVSYLGFNQIRNLAITASVSNIFKTDEAIGSYSRTQLWRHMVAVGVCARMTAARLKLLNFEEAFLAGLLHDIGIILEDQHCHEAFCEMITNFPDGATLVEAERRLLGFDHTMLGNRLAEIWRFPEAVRASIRFHHSPGSYRGEHSPVIHCIVLANWICSITNITAIGKSLAMPPTEAIAMLGLSREDVKVLVADLDHEMGLNQQLFEL